MAIHTRLNETAGPMGRGPRRGGGGGYSGGGFYDDTPSGDKQKTRDAKDATAQCKAVYKQLLPAALDKAVKAGVPKAWAQKYFDDFFEEQCDEDAIDMELMQGGPKRIKSVLAELKSFMKGDDVVADYGVDQRQNNIKDVKKAGETLFKNSSQKVAILKKLGLNGAEFHAFCLMVKEQIG